MRTIAVFTGNRAEYGLQFPILSAIDRHPELDYRLIVSGAHLDSNFGQTLSEIERDGFRVSAEVRIDLERDTLESTAKAIGSGTISMAEALARIQPDMLVVYADRFEGFAAVIAGTQMGLPTAHIEGGDVTDGGALDDSVRHAMSKLAHLHFTTNDEASTRLLAMGEEAWRVHTVGFPAIDLIAAGNFCSRDQVLELYGLDPERPIVLFTQHSVTTEFEQATQQTLPSLLALRRLAEEGVQAIVTYPNNDAGGRRIIELIDELDRENVPGIQVHRSLGRFNYHGVLALSQDPACRVVCAGNSSSGIKETPAFLCPTVNIGSRQLNRLRGSNVVDAGYNESEIYGAIKKALFDDDFRQICRATENPYGTGDAGAKVANALSKVPLDGKLLRKKMTLLGEERDGYYR